MSSPGGKPVAAVTVKISPDTSGFEQEVRRELAKVRDVEIPVSLDVDTAAVQREIEAIDVRDIPVDLAADVDQAALAGAISEIERFANQGTEVELNAELDTAAASAELAAFTSRPRRIEIETDVDTDRFSRILAGIGRAISGTFSGAFRSSGESAEGFGSTLVALRTPVVALLAGGVKLAAMGAGIAVAGAGITAAWGAAATVVAAVPAAIALIAAPVAAAVLGIDGIKKAAQTLAPEFARLKAAVSSTFAQGLLPVFERLRGVFPTLQAGLSGVASAVVSVADNVAEFLASTQGVALVKFLFDQVAVAVRAIGPGLTDLISGFLMLATQTGALQALVVPIRTLGREFNAAITNLDSAGTLQKAFAGLRDTLDLVAAGFVGLVSGGLRVFAAAAPGVNSLLASIGRFLGSFNWRALGVAVGSVFGGLAAAIDQVPPATIARIQAAFEGLGAVFQNAEFQAGIASFVSAIPTLINLVAGMTADFANLIAIGGDVIAFFNGLNTAVATAFQASADAGDWFFNHVTKPVVDAVSQLPGLIAAAWADVTSFFSTAWQSIKTGVIAAWAEISATVGAAVSGLGAVLAAAWQGIALAATTAFFLVKFAITDALGAIGKLVGPLLEPIRDAFQRAWDGLTRIVTTAFNAIKTTVKSSVEIVSSAVSAGWARVSAVTSSVFAAVRSFISSTWATISATVRSAVSAVQSAVQSGWNTVRSVTTSAWNAISSAISSAWNTIRSTVSSGMSAIASVVSSGVNTIIGYFRNLATQALDALRGMIGQAVSIGRSIIDGLLSGLRSAGGAVISYLQELASRALAAARAALGIASPSKEFFKIGEQVGQGLVLGIATAGDAVERTTSRMVSRALDGASSRMNGAFELGPANLGRFNSDVVRRMTVGLANMSPQGDTSPQVQVNFGDVNARADEDTPSAVARKMRTLSAMGVFT